MVVKPEKYKSRIFRVDFFLHLVSRVSRKLDKFFVLFQRSELSYLTWDQIKFEKWAWKANRIINS